MRLTFKTSLLLACLFMVVTPILVATFLFAREQEKSYIRREERTLKVWAKKLDNRMDGDFKTVLRDAGISENAPRADKIAALNKALSPIALNIVSGHDDAQLGIYSKDLQALVATAPKEYSNFIGVGIPEDHPGWKVLREGVSVFAQNNLIRQDTLCYFRPLERNGKVIGYVFANRNKSYLNAALWHQRKQGLLIAGISLIFGISLLMLLYRRFFGQLGEIVRGVKTLRGNLKYRLPVFKGEVGEVSEAVNDLASTLSDNQAFTALLLENDVAAIVAIDQEGVIRIFNKKAGHLLGVEPEIMIGRNFMELHDKISPGEETLLVKALKKGETFVDVATEMQLPWGPVTCSMNAYPILNGQGEIIGAVCSIVDITEKKEMEEKLRQLDKFSAVGQLAAGTAHEIRNPLTSIRGFLQLMAERLQENPGMQEYISIMTGEIDRISAITSEFLLLAKPTHPCFKVVDITAVLENIRLLLDSEALLRNVDLQYKAEKGMPRVNIDVEQIKQVFMNLASNALEAIDKGGKLSITVKYLKERQIITENGTVITDTVAISFTNSGPKIAKEVLAKIFDPFYTTKENGTGLGLTVSYQIVRNHGGIITVKSTKAGTSFTVELPALTDGQNPDA